MCTKKDRALEIMQDCIDSNYEYMVIRIKTAVHQLEYTEAKDFIYNITIRGEEQMEQFIKYIFDRYSDDLFENISHTSYTLLSVAGAHETNDLFVIDDALDINTEYIAYLQE